VWPAAEVERPTGKPVDRPENAAIGGNGVGDVQDVADLLAVAVDADRLASFIGSGRDYDPDGARIRRVWIGTLNWV
jgi:hypothetical protein